MSERFTASATNGGNDDNGGTRFFPWETIAKNEAEMAENDFLRFNGKDTFRQVQALGALILTAAGITVESYGTGQALITPANVFAVWTGPDGNGEYYKIDAGFAGHRIVIEDGVRMIGTINDSYVTADAPAVGTLLPGEFAFNGTNRIYIKPTSGDIANHVYEVSKGVKSAIYSDGFNDITIDNIHGYGAGGAPAIFNKNASNITITNCRADKSFRGIQVDGITGWSQLNNIVEFIDHQAIGSTNTSAASSNGLAAFNTVRNICNLKAQGGDGHGGTSQPASVNVVFEYNHFENIGSALAEAAGGRALVNDSGNDVIFRGNFCKNIQFAAIRHTARTQDVTGAVTSGNIIINSGVDSNTDDMYGSGGALNFDAQTSRILTAVAYNNTLNGNSFVSSVAGRGADIYGVARAGATLNLTIKNTIVSGSTSTFLAQFRRTNATTSTLNLTSDYNDFDITTSTTGGISRDDGDGVATTYTEANILGGAGTWQTDESQDANSIASDPLFMDLVTFRIPESSPCFGSGEYISGLKDKNGTLFDSTSSPIGALANNLLAGSMSTMGIGR